MTDTRTERLEVIRAFVAERLFRSPDEVQPHSRLISDLGADSLDFVDIQFQMEKRFGFEFHNDDLLDTSHRWVGPGGFLQPEAAERFTRYLPALANCPDPERIAVSELMQLITVETLLLMVEAKLSESLASAEANQ
jgi:acyl carrier protein